MDITNDDMDKKFLITCIECGSDKVDIDIDCDRYQCIEVTVYCEECKNSFEL